MTQPAGPPASAPTSNQIDLGPVNLDPPGPALARWRSLRLLAGAHLQARQATEDLSDAIEALPTDAPLFAVVDAVVALAHLKLAVVTISKASDSLEADAEAEADSAEVTR